MFRRPSTPPPPPLGLEELETEPRSPLVSRRNVVRAVAIFAGAVAWGAAVRLADSLPLNMAFIDFVLKVGVGFAFVLAIALLLLFRGFEVDRVAIVVILAFSGGYVGAAIGPTVPPAVTVTGRFTFAPTVPPGLPGTTGDVACEWANGRWSIGMLETGPLNGFAIPHLLTVDMMRRTITLHDGGHSTLLQVGDAPFVPPPGTPPWGPGDRSGTMDMSLLQVNVESTPTDPNQVDARLTWDCPGPPPG
jgi:hypothetical protein